MYSEPEFVTGKFFKYIPAALLPYLCTEKHEKTYFSINAQTCNFSSENMRLIYENLNNLPFIYYIAFLRAKENFRLWSI